MTKFKRVITLLSVAATMTAMAALPAYAGGGGGGLLDLDLGLNDTLNCSVHILTNAGDCNH